MQQEFTDWPKLYNFPPFFTIQPNKETLEKQLNQWCQLVLNYSKILKITLTSIDELEKTQLFYNKNINRKLSKSGIIMVLNKLESNKHLEWLDTEKNKCLIIQMNFNELSLYLEKYIKSKMISGSIVTLDELISDPIYSQQPFFDCHSSIIYKSLQLLHNNNVIVLFNDKNNNVGFKVV